MTHDDRTRIETVATLSYRCVCGESFDIPTGEDAPRCPACDRLYSAAAVKRAAAQTLSIGGQQAIPIGDAAAEQDERIGQRLDHFHILELLGQGGMGAVYKALDESLQRYVALKVVRTAGGSSDGSSRSDKIVEEARAQARVSHPNVVHIYYVGRDEAAPFFAMELLPGPTLSEQLKHGPLPFGEVVHVALQIVDALEQAADYDIVHGDIKPSNILVAGKDKHGNIFVKLSDFGLAQRISRGDESSHGITGTPDYLSPEAAAGKALVRQSDIYSLGVTLFELTFGRLPYQRPTDSLMEKLETHISSPVDFPDPWPVRVPEPWRGVLQRMMAKQSTDRYATYADLRLALHQLQPVALPQAGRLPRALAWLVDLGLVLALYVIVFGTMHAITTAIEFQSGAARLSWLHFLIAVASTMAPAAAMALQTLWGTTPGKKMFQLRIVTPYGLPPPNRTMAARSLFQFMPIWLLLVGGIFAMVFPPIVVLFVVGSGYLFLVLDVAMALLHPQRRSLHDWALHTQVVLDSPAKHQGM